MKKLCIDARMLYSSGIGTYLQSLLPTLAERYNLTLIGDAQEISSYQAIKITSNISIYSVQEIFKFPSLVPKCDIFWSPHYNVPILPIKAKKRLVTIHDVYHLAFLETLSLKQKLYAKIMMQAAVKKSHHVITVSQFSKKEIVKYTACPSDKIRVIYNGVNHAHFYPIRDSKRLQSVTKKYRLPNSFILFVGNVKPHKNLISLINAFALIRDKFPHLSLVIVGKKEGFITNDNHVFDRISHDKSLEDSIHFTGFVADEDLPAIYSLADLFVFPSLYEGFGLPPLEAMACACPVLVSNYASMPEICGADIHYTDPTDAQQMATDIQKILSYPQKEKDKVIKKGLQQVTSYTWDQSIREHVNLLDSL
ncbi:glycosyltransferase involved in cell wall biosynthesis [Catalinimonas alkaloidigena]|uniref:glycosyltransferase family 4 protein n=1 Tax=Catalinimonas alkaloidigena TaxID=1075417 RepID=UPI002406318D|nr:glycosyltransferase family 1 protein [Catalinimonas alkaloidigena]MDF9801083.1 glycosyltransferase involved in cell wall biosynthesis [Catalinimonas alkaloidigena]